MTLYCFGQAENTLWCRPYLKNHDTQLDDGSSNEANQPHARFFLKHAMTVWKHALSRFGATGASKRSGCCEAFSFRSLGGIRE
jgi:hypothetical protein